MALSPKYDKRNRTTGAKRFTGPSQADMRGRSVPPENPTGRLVESEDSHGLTVVHWAPAEGVDWTCPDCTTQLRRAEDREGSPWSIA